MVKEIRLLDAQVYCRIREACSTPDLEHSDCVAQLCAEALHAMRAVRFRMYCSRPYAEIAKQSWLQVTRAMFETFVRDSRQMRTETMEEWGEELASHLAIVLAMP